MARPIDTGSEQLTAEVGDDGVCILPMNRPEARNAMTGGMLSGLALALAEAETALDVRCVVLTGTGSVEHLAENAASIDAPPLPPDHLARLASLFGHLDTVTSD